MNENNSRLVPSFRGLESIEDFVEQLLAPSIVLIRRDNEACGTGFFISHDGELATCSHLLPDSSVDAEFSATVGDATVLITYIPELSNRAEDLAIFRASPQQGVDFIPAPLLVGEQRENLSSSSRAITIGYPGLVDKSAPLALRRFPGSISNSRLWKGPAKHWRLETLDMSPSRGASGAPIFDLKRFRVVGFNQGRLGGEQNGVVELDSRIGRGCPVSVIQERRPQLVPTWVERGRVVDQGKRLFLTSRFDFWPEDLTNLNDLRILVEEASTANLEPLHNPRVASAAGSITRDKQIELDAFFDDEHYHVLLLTGASGTGKTTLLIQQAQRSGSANFDLILFQSLRNLQPEHLSESLSRRLHLEAHVERFLSTADGGQERLLLLLDAFEDVEHPTQDKLRQLLSDAVAMSSRASRRIKIVISVKREWLNDMWPDLLRFKTDGYSNDPLLSNLFPEYSDGSESHKPLGRSQLVTSKQRPSVELPLLGDAKTRNEQEALYEAYRAALAVAKPIEYSVSATSFELLPPLILSVLDRPLIIRMFTEHYSDKPIPDAPLRSQFIQEIVQSQIAKVTVGATQQMAARTLLESLAFELMISGRSSITDRELLRFSWCNPDILERIVSQTLYLSIRELGSQARSAMEIAFASDWLADYFCGQYLMAECSRLRTSSAQAEYLIALATKVSAGGTTTGFLAAFSYLAEFALMDARALFDAVWHVWSMEKPASLLQEMVTSTAEYIRSTYGFQAGELGGDFLRTIVEASTSASHLAWRRLLYAAERLGDQGTEDALKILDSCPEDLYSTDSLLLGSLLSLRALKLFGKHEVDKAMILLDRLEPGTSDEVILSRTSFVRGRCLQFRKQYPEALAEFENGAKGTNDYASMCRHQIGFIVFLSESNYSFASAILAKNDSLHASRLLLAQCLLELGDYRRTADIIHNELAYRKRPRRTLSYGKVKRVEAQLFTRLFRLSSALGAAEEAEECTKYSTYYLAHANVLETKAMIVGPLMGDLDQALILLNESIELASQAKHDPTRSWALQSLAFVEAINGASETVEELLEKSTKLFSNPNQHRRTALIRILVRHLNGGLGSALIEDYEKLKREYLEAGQSWYVSVIALLVHSLSGQQIENFDLVKHFGEDVSTEGISQTEIFRVIGLL